MGEVMTQEEVKYLLKRYSQHLSAGGALGKAPAARVNRGYFHGRRGERTGRTRGFRQSSTNMYKIRQTS